MPGRRAQHNVVAAGVGAQHAVKDGPNQQQAKGVSRAHSCR